jgi:hypothetical protein
MKFYPKEFFRLQIEFAMFLSEQHNYDLPHAMFLFTSLYVRIIGYSEDDFPEEQHRNWTMLIQNMPLQNINTITDYFYENYYAVEIENARCPDVSSMNCFSYHYHQRLNMYELHFSPNDSKGNLTKGRKTKRLEELKSMFREIKKNNIHNAKDFFTKTWLLNINSFNRLFPDEFSSKARLWERICFQENVYWGQFVDRKKNLDYKVVQQFKENYLNGEYSDPRLYFPFPAWYSQLELEEFYRFYGI